MRTFAYGLAWLDGFHDRSACLQKLHICTDPSNLALGRELCRSGLRASAQQEHASRPAVPGAGAGMHLHGIAEPGTGRGHERGAAPPHPHCVHSIVSPRPATPYHHSRLQAMQGEQSSLRRQSISDWCPFSFSGVTYPVLSDWAVEEYAATRIPASQAPCPVQTNSHTYLPRYMVHTHSVGMIPIAYLGTYLGAYWQPPGMSTHMYLPTLHRTFLPMNSSSWNEAFNMQAPCA